MTKSDAGQVEPEVDTRSPVVLDDEAWSLTSASTPITTLMQAGRAGRKMSVMPILGQTQASLTDEALEALKSRLSQILGEEEVTALVKEYEEYHKHKLTVYTTRILVMSLLEEQEDPNRKPSRGTKTHPALVVPLPEEVQVAVSQLQHQRVGEWLAAKPNLVVSGRLDARFVQQHLPDVFDEHVSKYPVEVVDSLMENWHGSLGDLLEACRLLDVR